MSLGVNMAEQAINLNYLIDPFEQFMNLNGKPLVGGYITLYLAGTNEKYISYQNFDYTQNPFKIPINSDGRVTILVDVSQAYDAYVYSSNGNLIVSRLNLSCPGGVAGGGLRQVIHDDTMTGKGTQLSPLGVSPLTNLAVDDTMTAYEATVEGKESIVLGVNGDWFNEQFGSAFSGKLDTSSFNSAYYDIKGGLSSKVDWSAMSSYYNKNETYNYFLPRSAIDLTNYYTKNEVYNKNEVDSLLNYKQEKLEFNYDENSAISAINGSALAGQGGGGSGDCPWISGAKEISSMGYLQPGQWFQAISSFTMSGAKNHFISMKGGAYNFPTTSHFYEWLDLSSYLPITSFTGYTANADSRMTTIFNLANSAYTTAVNNFYNKLDISAFSAWSAVQDPVLIGDANITATSSKVDSHTQWNLAVNVAPVVTDTKLIGDNCVTAHTTDTSGEWIVGLVQSAYEAIDSISGISSDVDVLKNASGSYYPLTGNPSGFLTAHQTIPSAKWEDTSNVVQTNSGDWGNGGDSYTALTSNSAYWNESTTVVQSNSGNWNDVFNLVATYSAKWLINGDV